MNRQQALTAVRKLLGKEAAIRDLGRATSPEDRARSAHSRLNANDRLKTARKALDDRRDALLDGDALYRQLRVDYEAARAQRDACPHEAFRYSAVRLVGGAFYLVEAEADNLEDLVAAVQAKKG